MLMKPDEEAVLEQALCQRARANFSNILSFLRAFMRGRVSRDIEHERATTCAKCQFLCKSPKGDFCRICGCGVDGRFAGPLVQLTRYKEGPSKDGKLCHHPERFLNKGGWRV